MPEAACANSLPSSDGCRGREGREERELHFCPNKNKLGINLLKKGEGTQAPRAPRDPGDCAAPSIRRARPAATTPKITCGYNAPAFRSAAAFLYVHQAFRCARPCLRTLVPIWPFGRCTGGSAAPGGGPWNILCTPARNRWFTWRGYVLGFQVNVESDLPPSRARPRAPASCGRSRRSCKPRGPNVFPSPPLMDQSAAIMEAMQHLERKVDALLAQRTYRPRQIQGDDELLSRVLAAIVEHMGDECFCGAFTVHEALTYLRGNNVDVFSAVSQHLGGDGGDVPRRLGNMLRRAEGRVIAGMEVVRLGKDKNAVLWQLRKLVPGAQVTSQN
jgi:hypothetical protein